MQILMNNLRPFATNPYSNIFSDDQLASAPELENGFVRKNVVDSALVGKLFANNSAAAYAVGQLISDVLNVDVTSDDYQAIA